MFEAKMAGGIKYYDNLANATIPSMLIIVYLFRCLRPSWRVGSTIPTISSKQRSRYFIFVQMFEAKMAGGINDPDDLVKATIPLFYICSDV
jgi:hypothetical protein